MVLLVIAASVALLLGIYGVMSFHQRTGEIDCAAGPRRKTKKRRRHDRATGGVVALVGTVVGIGTAFATNRLISHCSTASVQSRTEAREGVMHDAIARTRRSHGRSR